MAESKTHFKIKKGQIEIEYEGSASEVNKRYDKAFDWVSSLKIDENLGESKEIQESPDNKKGEGKKSGRGGSRQTIYPPEIEKLVKDTFFKPKKTVDEVIAKFESSNVVTRGKRNAILMALKYYMKKKGSKLNGTKEGKNWVFWQD